MSEIFTPIKTFNGHSLVDTVAREQLSQLSEAIGDNQEQLSQLSAEIENRDEVETKADATDERWSMWNSRLAFGMNPDSAPVPFWVKNQMLVDGTIIAHNNGTQDKNRWGFHVLEAYAKDNYSRMTMLLDKHSSEADGKPSMEVYYYIGESHNASAYGNTKIGSDVKYHSFCFNRDKMTAYGEIVNKMPITLAKISLANGMDTTYETVSEADSAYDPEIYPEQNNRCLKYIALKNAENGAMFYDTDRDRAVIKIGGLWCDLPFTVIEDPSYSIFQQDKEITWRQGSIDKDGYNAANNRIMTNAVVGEDIAEIEANDGYLVGLACFDGDDFIGYFNTYYIASLDGMDNEKYAKKWNLKAARTLGYSVKAILVKSDFTALTPEDGVNANFNTTAAMWESGSIYDLGGNFDMPTRLRMTEFVDEDKTMVSASSGYSVLAVVSDGVTFTGARHWDASANKVGNGTNYTQSVDLTQIRDAGYNYIRIVARREDNAAITVSESENIIFS